MTESKDKDFQAILEEVYKHKIETLERQKARDYSPFLPLNDSEEMINVGMNQWGVTQGDRPNPILKTTGLGPCVAVVMYDPEVKVAGLLHEKGQITAEGTQDDIRELFSALQRNGVPFATRERIQLHLIGGYENGKLPGTAERAASQLGIRNVVTNLRTRSAVLNVAVDSKTGELFSVVNIIPKTISALEQKQAIFLPASEITSDPRSLK